MIFKIKKKEILSNICFVWLFFIILPAVLGVAVFLCAFRLKTSVLPIPEDSWDCFFLVESSP
jgi:hypothetical protein